MKLSVFGLGYVGCVTAACLAKAGHEVVGVDLSEDKVRMINAGQAPLIEPGLGDLVADLVERGQLRASSSALDAVGQSDLALICVGTPSGVNGQIDVGAIKRVAFDIGQALRARVGRYTIVLRSTVLPGTTESVLVPALAAGLGRPANGIHIALNPEFMREGSSLHDFEHPPLTLVGCSDMETANQLRDLYGAVDAPFVQTSVEVAEMAKYVSNAFHALKICFANEIGDLSTAFGVDAHEVMRVFLMDRKLNVSEAYLRPGFAFGGSCLPKDLRALVHAARTEDIELPLLSAIAPSNEQQIQRGIDSVLSKGRKRVGVVGLAFKPGTDDTRESPMVRLVETLIGKGRSVRIFDPNVHLAGLVGANRQYIEQEIPHITSLICEGIGDLLAHAEVVVIGSPGEIADRVLDQCQPHHLVVDLTRMVKLSPLAADTEEAPLGQRRARV